MPNHIKCIYDAHNFSSRYWLFFSSFSLSFISQFSSRFSCPSICPFPALFSFCWMFFHFKLLVFFRKFTYSFYTLLRFIDSAFNYLSIQIISIRTTKTRTTIINNTITTTTTSHFQFNCTWWILSLSKQNDNGNIEGKFIETRNLWWPNKKKIKLKRTIVNLEIFFQADKNNFLFALPLSFSCFPFSIFLSLSVFLHSHFVFLLPLDGLKSLISYKNSISILVVFFYLDVEPLECCFYFIYGTHKIEMQIFRMYSNPISARFVLDFSFDFFLLVVFFIYRSIHLLKRTHTLTHRIEGLWWFKSTTRLSESKMPV